MFTAFIQDSNKEVVEIYNNCFKVAIYSERDMKTLFPDYYEAIAIHSPYLHLVDSQGNHFYPLYIYSVEIG